MVGEICTVLRLRLMRKLAMSHIYIAVDSENRLKKNNIGKENQTDLTLEIYIVYSYASDVTQIMKEQEV